MKNITLSLSDDLFNQMKAYPEVNWSGLARQCVENYLKLRRAPPHPRTLDNEVPELKPFLQPGMNVLDVGCGFGTITLGVAEVVKPGQVIGVDPIEKYIDAARAWAAANPQTNNITFQVGYGYHLKFPDDTFDVVYSNTVLHYFFDPVLGLKEQQRVAKPGGWVIASGVRDYIIFRHPHCPHWEKLIQAYQRYMDTCIEEYRVSGKDPVTFLEEQLQSSPSEVYYVDMHAGRKCLESFRQAGFTDVHLKVQPRRVKYQGQEGMKPDIWDMLVLDDVAYDEPTSELQGFLKTVFQRMIAMGFLNDETLEQAKAEIRAWYNHPGAFHSWPEVFVAGRVP